MRWAGLSLIISAFLLSSCARTHSTRGYDSEYTFPISIENLRVNMEFLASDELEGRDTASRGEDLAALYLKSELQKCGVQYLPELGNYYQTVELVKTWFDDSSTIKFLDDADNEIGSFITGTHFVGSSRLHSAVDTVAGFVFAGYGIKADEYDYNDYDSIDVKGKIVMVWPGEPESMDSSFFDGAELTKYSGLYSKVSTAREQGALAIFLVSKMEAQYGWQSILDYSSGGRFSLKNPVEQEKDRRRGRIPMAVIKSETLEDILSLGKYNYDEIQTAISQGQMIPRFEFDFRSAINWKFKSDSTVKAKNVVGFFKGNDPVLRDEYVAIGCHYDHVGRTAAGIYNGADDDASGTVTVLEVAKAVALNNNLRRSVLFIFHTGEEKGLLGSKFLTANLKAVENIVSYINLDMVGRGATDSIYNIGANRLSTEFSEIVEEANKRSANMIFDFTFDDPQDPNRYYYRSDHYRYARLGIPVVFFFDNMKEDYHKFTDTAEKINYAKLAKISDLSYHIIQLTANRDIKPVVDKEIAVN